MGSYITCAHRYRFNNGNFANSQPGGDYVMYKTSALKRINWRTPYISSNPTINDRNTQGIPHGDVLEVSFRLDMTSLMVSKVSR